MKMRRFSSGARRVFAGAAAMAIAVVLAAVPPLAAGSYAGESAGADVIAAAAAEPTAGDIVYFGTYPQTLIGHSEDVGVPDVPYRSVTYTDKYYEEQNGTYYYAAEPVAWRVLAKDGGRLFLLSEKQLIGGIAYNDVIGPPAAIQWSGSTMRGYLNGTMIGDLFTAEEQTAVAAARLVNDTDFDFRNGEDGAVTDDKLFLLSLRELLAYLPEMASREAPITDFADDRGQYAQPRSETPNHGAVSTAWWLREGGPYNQALLAFDVGTLDEWMTYTYSATYGYPEYYYYHIRPAMELDLSAVEFAAAENGGYTALIPQEDEDDADTGALSDLWNGINNGIGEGLTIAADAPISENYTAAVWMEFVEAYELAEEIIHYPDGVTQAAADAAAARLAAAYANLAHSHTVLGGAGAVFEITENGRDVSLRFSGYIGSVAAAKGLTFGDWNLQLIQRGAALFDIVSGGVKLGTITEGSAIVTLSSDFVDGLANGEYALSLPFDDGIRTGAGAATVKVARTQLSPPSAQGAPLPPANADIGKTAGASSPRTDDPFTLWGWMALLVCSALLLTGFSAPRIWGRR